MALAALAEHADTQAAGIGESVRRIMAACTREPSILRETSVKEQTLPQSHHIPFDWGGGRRFRRRVALGGRVIALPASEAEAQKRCQDRLSEKRNDASRFHFVKWMPVLILRLAAHSMPPWGHTGSTAYP